VALLAYFEDGANAVARLAAQQGVRHDKTNGHQIAALRNALK
jgi:hypothetical protein